VFSGLVQRASELPLRAGDANYRDFVDKLVNFTDIGVPGACNGVHGIYSSSLRGHLSNNIVYRVSAFGIHLWHAATRATVANHTVFSNGSGSMGGGIIISSGDKSGGVVLNYTKVINNIVYDNPAASIVEYCYAGQDCTGSNNTGA
jgi:hypothetical protein